MPTTTIRPLNSTECKIYDRGAYKHWKLNVPSPESTRPFLYRLLKYIQARYGDFRVFLRHVPTILKFFRDLAKLAGWRFYGVVALTLVRSYLSRCDLAVIQQLSGLVIGVARGRPLQLKTLGSIWTRFFVIRVLLKVVTAYFLISWKEYVQLQLNLEVSERIMDLKCTLSDDELSLPRIKKLSKDLQSLTSADFKIEPFESSDDVKTHYNPMALFSLVQQLFSITGTAMFLIRQPKEFRLPVLGTQVIKLGFRGLNKLIRSYRGDDIREMSNIPYLQMGRLFGLATSSALHREVSTLNMKPYLLKSFKEARNELSSTLSRVDDRDWNLAHDAQDGLLGIFNSDPSIKILTYVFFAFQARVAKDSASVLAACVQSDYFANQVEDLINQGEVFQECSEGVVDILNKLTAFCDVKEITTALLGMRSDLKPYVSNGEGGMEIEFKNVTVQNPSNSDSPPILNQVNFKINPGQIIAIVGSNGSGKSTMFNLLASEMKPTKGEILINGTKMTEYNKMDLMAQMSFTFQYTPPLPFSVKDSVGLGCIECIDDSEKISQALNFSQGTEVIADLAEGLDTYGDGIEGASMESSWTLPRMIPPRKIIAPMLVTTLKEHEGGEKNDATKIAASPEQAATSSEDEAGADEVTEFGESDTPDLEEAVETTDEETGDHATLSPSKVSASVAKKEKREALQRKTGSTIWEGSLRSTPEYDQDIWLPLEEPMKRKMSGGQWQRISLARSFAKPKDLIVLDEPTGSIDPASEAKFFNNLLGLKGKSTVMFITQSMAYAAKADGIMVLNGGKLAEFGTHEELMKIEDGRYRKMWEVAQSSFNK